MCYPLTHAPHATHATHQLTLLTLPTYFILHNLQYIYIYIYTHTHTHIYMLYIYIYNFIYIHNVVDLRGASRAPFSSWETAVVIFVVCAEPGST